MAIEISAAIAKDISGLVCELADRMLHDGAFSSGGVLEGQPLYRDFRGIVPPSFLTLSSYLLSSWAMKSFKTMEVKNG